MLSSRRIFIEIVVEKIIVYEWLFGLIIEIEREAIIEIMQVANSLCKVDLLWFQNLQQNGYSRLINDVEKRIDERLEIIRPIMNCRKNSRIYETNFRREMKMRIYKPGRWFNRIK